MTVRKREENEVLFHQHDVGDSYLNIIKGSVRVIENGKIVADLGAGESFGEAGCMGVCNGCRCDLAMCAACWRMLLPKHVCMTARSVRCAGLV